MDEYYNEQQQEIEECFKMFDKDKDGYVTLKELELVFRALGYDYTDYEIMDFIKETEEEVSYNKNNESLISFAIYNKILKTQLKDVLLEQELLSAFSNFIKDDRDLIPISEFKHIMNSLGDKLAEEEVEEMAKDADPKGVGMVDCREFIKLLVSK